MVKMIPMMVIEKCIVSDFAGEKSKGELQVVELKLGL